MTRWVRAGMTRWVSAGMTRGGAGMTALCGGQVIQDEQDEIPLNPPFKKGGNKVDFVCRYRIPAHESKLETRMTARKINSLYKKGTAIIS